VLVTCESVARTRSKLAANGADCFRPSEGSAPKEGLKDGTLSSSGSVVVKRSNTLFKSSGSLRDGTNGVLLPASALCDDDPLRWRSGAEVVPGLVRGIDFEVDVGGGIGEKKPVAAGVGFLPALP
jgi:hypothetical protein